MLKREIFVPQLVVLAFKTEIRNRSIESEVQ